MLIVTVLVLMSGAWWAVTQPFVVPLPSHPPAIDPARLKQAFLNLALNAIQAMPDGGVLKISTRRTEDRLELYFEDTGQGIDSADLKEIFTPFFSTRASGTGLGLAITRRIVESHGGTIRAEQKDPGTRFIMTLPILME